MKTLDRYILAKTLWPLAATAGVALLALLLERSVRLMDLLVNKGGPLYLMLRMLANLIPHYLGMALPAAFFIGVLLAAMRMTSDSETDAINASGVSLQRMLAPIMALAVLLVFVGAALFGFLQPHTRYGYRALVYLATETAWNAAVEQGAFFTGFGDTTLMADDIHDGGRRLSGIFVHQQGEDGTTTTTTAESGSVFRSRSDMRLILSLEQGVRVTTSATGAQQVLSFQSLDLPLEMALDIAPPTDRGEESERELTLPELLSAPDQPSGELERSEIDAEIHARLVQILNPLCLPFLAFAIGVAGRRTSRGAAFSVAIAIIVIYHHVLQFGEELADAGSVSPFLALWVPFFALFALSIWMFRAAAMRPGYNPFVSVLSLVDRSSAALRALARPRRSATAS
jgi:lipopolysaccharide export system permease protein